MNAMIIFLIGLGLWVTCSSLFTSFEKPKAAPVVRAVNALALTVATGMACLVNGNISWMPVMIAAFIGLGVGDVLLMLSSQKSSEPEKSNFFLVGTVVFLLSYTCLDVWAIGASSVTWLTWLICALVFLTVNAIQYFSLDKTALKGKEIAIGIYMLQVTFAMTVGLAALLTAQLTVARILLGTGMLSFAVSDLIIGHAAFHSKPVTWSDYFVQPTYIFGMLGVIGYLLLR